MSVSNEYQGNSKTNNRAHVETKRLRIKHRCDECECEASTKQDLPVIFLQVDDLEHLPQVAQFLGDSVLLVAGLLKHIAGLRRLDLIQVPKTEHRHPSKDGFHLPSYLSQAEIQVVQHI